MRIGLLPLDERPANTRYPAMVAAIAGVELALPPAAVLSARRRPADSPALGAWLRAAVPGLDGLIVSLEQLGYGGLIASRTSDEPAAAVLGRLEILRELRRTYPRLPIYGFSLVMRVSNADDAVEEPAYWAEYGTRLYALSQLLDRRRQGQDVGDAIARLEAAIPAEQRRDMLRRRLRNHSVNLAALGLLDDGTLDLLILSSDDTSPFGLPSAERTWLEGWAGLLADAGTRAQGDKASASASARADSLPHFPTAPLPHSLLMYPGADEVGCVLVARLLNERAGFVPNVEARYAPPADAANVAAYEDGPISRTVERQIVAAGGRLLPHAPTPPRSPDLWLGVNAPLARRAEWEPEHAASERAERQDALEALLDEARARLDAGCAVALADVAYPNGADPVLVALMREAIDLPKLAGYAAWNTAGNSVGTVLAQAFAVRHCHTAAGRAAHQRLLLHRLLEDWGYQQVVRRELRAWLRSTTGHHDPTTPEQIVASCERAEAALRGLIGQLPGFAAWRIVPGSVRLPWNRSFEIDFALEGG